MGAPGFGGTETLEETNGGLKNRIASLTFISDKLELKLQIKLAIRNYQRKIPQI